jgi:hypothetical protein
VALAADRNAPVAQQTPSPPEPPALNQSSLPVVHPGESDERPPSSLPAPRSFERGLLLLPYVGLQFPIAAIGWISSGFRLGTLIGGHLSEKVSLSTELAFATWTWDVRTSWDAGAPMESRRAGQVDIGTTMLRHASVPWGEVIFGPKLGGTMMLRHEPGDVLRTYVNGWLAGLKMGVLVTLSRSTAVGIVADFSAIVNPIETEADCFTGEEGNSIGSSRCTRARTTLLGSVSAAALF